MLTETFRSIFAATRKVLSDWRALLLVAMVYAALLATLYFFVAVREASLGQVILTFVLAIAAPLLFFLLQSMVASQTAAANDASLLKRSLRTSWKVFLISLPLIGIAVLITYLLAKTQNYGVAINPKTLLPYALAENSGPRQRPPAINWKVALLSTVRYLAFGLVLPLAAVHLWLATAREGLVPTLRRAGSHLARAFAPRSVLTYLAGFLIFAVVPYFLLFRTTQTSHAWLELALLVARLALIFALTLFGWMITVRALAPGPTETAANPVNETA